MASIPNEKLDQLLGRWQKVQDQLSSSPDQESYVRLSKEFAELDPVCAVVRSLREAEKEIAGIDEMLADPGADKEMSELATVERGELIQRLAELDHRLQILLLPKDIADDRSAILELRAGTGGDEAALFAGDLFRMYQRYADLKGWKMQVISANEAALGGFKEVIVSVSGSGVFARLKFESGVHRVQRVPETESGGRIHTSAATVAVLPEAEEVDIEINDNDLRIDVFRSSGPGGQSVNTTDSAVRVTHLPTGLVVQQQDEKSQHKNRAKALQVLRARLYDLERQKLDAERSATRRGMVGSGDRSQRIRTYNFPQSRVTDHRINLTLHKLDAILAGYGLDEMIDALITQHQADQLAAMNEDAAAAS